MKPTEASDLLRGTYLEALEHELANMPKTKHRKVVCCCKCGSSQTTLRKLGNKYCCIRCYKELL